MKYVSTALVLLLCAAFITYAEYAYSKRTFHIIRILSYLAAVLYGMIVFG
jgi:hypothetical protein